MEERMRRFNEMAELALKDLGLGGAKLLGFSCKNGEYQLIYILPHHKLPNLSQEISWKEGVAIWEKISKEVSEVDGGGTSLRDSILDVIENKARRVRVSNLARMEMMELGEILERSMIPKGAGEDVVKRISAIATMLSPERDEKSAHSYLLDLAARIYLSN